MATLKEKIAEAREKRIKWSAYWSTSQWLLDTQSTINYIRSLVPNVFSFFEKTERKEKIKAHKNISMYNGDRKMDLAQKSMERRTNVKTPYSKIFCSTYYNRFFDTEFNIEVQALDEKWKKAKESIDALNSWAYADSMIQVEMKKAIKDAIDTKDGYLCVGMSISDEKRQLIVDEMSWSDENINNIKKDIFVKYCNATAEYVPWEEIIYDVKAWFEKSLFVWRRKVESSKAFYARLWQYINVEKDIQTYVDDPKNAIFLYGKDMSQFRKLKEYEETLVSRYISMWYNEDDVYRMSSEDLWEYWETYEHWTDDTLTIVRNWHVLVDIPNPLWINMHPYVHFEWPWIGLLLIGLQEMYDLVYNWYGDYLKRHFNPMYMATWWQWVDWFEEWYLDREPYKIVKNLWDGKIERVDLWDDVKNWFAMLQSLWELWSQISQVNRYTQAWPTKWVERSKWAVDYLVQITSEWLKPLWFSISIALNRCSRIWTRLAKTRLPEKFKISIMWKDKQEVFKEIKLSDFDNEFIVRYSSESIGEYNKQKDLNNINWLLQYIQKIWVDPETGVYLFKQRDIAEKIAWLWDLDSSVLSNSEFEEKVRERIEAQQKAALMAQNKNNEWWQKESWEVINVE